MQHDLHPSLRISDEYRMDTTDEQLLPIVIPQFLSILLTPSPLSPTAPGVLQHADDPPPRPVLPQALHHRPHPAGEDVGRWRRWGGGRGRLGTGLLGSAPVGWGGGYSGDWSR